MTHRILVIDGDPQVARDLEEALAGQGCELLAVVSSGEDGLQLVAEVRPDLCLVDLHLVGPTTGIVTGRQLRAKWNIPVVYLTARADDEILEDAKATQPYGYLSKPFNAISLGTTIEIALNQYRLESLLRAQQEKLAEQAEELRALSLLDALTGLYNQRGFATLAEQHLKVVERAHRSAVLLVVDLEGLPEINEEQGRKVGDDAVRATASVLKHTFRECDIIARLGGNRFAVLAVDAARVAAEVLCNRLTANLLAYNEEAPRTFDLRAHIGSACKEASGHETLETLIAKADAIVATQKRAKKRIEPKRQSAAV